MACTLAATDGLTIKKIIDDGSEFRSHGAATYIITTERGVDGVSCERLRDINGVRSAGAVRTVSPTPTLLALPAGTLPLHEATRGFLPLLGIEARVAQQASYVISRPAADQLSAESGSDLATSNGVAHVDALYEYPDDGRNSSLLYAAVSVAPKEGRFDECWIQVWPLMDAVPTLLRTTLSASVRPDAKVRISQLNSRLGERYDGLSLYENRLTRYASLAGMALGLCIGALSVRLRRLELAAALHVGVSRAALTTQIALETLTSAAITAALCSPVLAVIAHSAGSVNEIGIFVTEMEVVLASSIGCLIGSVAGTITVRNRHLFNYFKAR
ncbi:hypothetical protein [Dactylosporangium sp. NPDC050588]|uniref:hypothetical protein n=1 Tax=Dactylosporangium sp. NPDC050588 TaxID=3157211 RepID=UPI0033E44E14